MCTLSLSLSLSLCVCVCVCVCVVLVTRINDDEVGRAAIHPSTGSYEHRDAAHEQLFGGSSSDPIGGVHVPDTRTEF